MSAVLQNPGVERVRAALAAAKLDAEIVELPGAARTARAAADYLGCEVAQIANSLVFRALRSDAALLVLSSGARRVDLERLAAIAGEPVGKADADFVRLRTGFAIGGVAPVGHTGAVRSFVERALAAHDPLWAAAGHPHTVFRLSYADLLRISGAAPIDAASA
ncbi:MAG: YbaK/EbsC family protein [Burkholderiales bacterium]|nr:YbaK/EbsC family protein [Burkholderiales bacterium]